MKLKEEFPTIEITLALFFYVCQHQYMYLTA